MKPESILNGRFHFENSMTTFQGIDYATLLTSTISDPNAKTLVSSQKQSCTLLRWGTASIL